MKICCLIDSKISTSKKWFSIFLADLPLVVVPPLSSDYTAKVVRSRLSRVGVKTLNIEPGSPWENGYIESFNGKLRDELPGNLVIKKGQMNSLLDNETNSEKITKNSSDKDEGPEK